LDQFCHGHSMHRTRNPGKSRLRVASPFGEGKTGDPGLRFLGAGSNLEQF
jgi:hypothetical protein